MIDTKQSMAQKFFVYQAYVYNVVDGDTIDAEIDLGFKIKVCQRLRLARVDTPEKGQPGFEEAKEFVKKLVLSKDVTVSTQKVSKWGYYLADVEIEGLSLSDMLLKTGLAVEYFGGKKPEESNGKNKADK